VPDSGQSDGPGFLDGGVEELNSKHATGKRDSGPWKNKQFAGPCKMADPG
jgi:hypothetical protein